MLRQRLRAARANDEGFTLIELLIVVVILGVLSGIVVFAVSNFNENGATAACKTDLKTVESAVEAYYAQQGHTYPTAMQDLLDKKYLREAPPASEGIKIAIDGSGTVTGGC